MFEIPYIPGTAKLKRTKKTQVWEYKQTPSIYIPPTVRINDDQAKYYAKTPQEMSRFEIADVEQELRELDAPEEFVPDDEMYGSEEFEDLKQQLKALMPIRRAWMKKYIERYKWNGPKREELLALINQSEE